MFVSTAQKHSLRIAPPLHIFDVLHFFLKSGLSCQLAFIAQHLNEGMKNPRMSNIPTQEPSRHASLHCIQEPKCTISDQHYAHERHDVGRSFLFCLYGYSVYNYIKSIVPFFCHEVQSFPSCFWFSPFLHIPIDVPTSISTTFCLIPFLRADVNIFTGKQRYLFVCLFVCTL
jgi:hypothetical protein